MALVTMTGTALGGAVLAAMPSVETPSDDSMPGLGSFIVFAFLAAALYFLLKNMNARLRRMSYREKEREAAELAAAREADEARLPDEAPDPDNGGMPRA